MSAISITKARQQRKKDLVKVHGEKCKLCDYSKCIGALQFHHINAEDKGYTLSNGNCHSLESDLEESKKCILVCANCHQEIHSGLITEELYSSYNEALAKELIEEKQIIKNVCSICQKEISNGAKYCSKCSHELRRIVERPDREQLKTLIRNNPFTKIGEMFGVTDNSIRKWCENYSLPKKKADINKYTDDEWEKI